MANVEEYEAELTRIKEELAEHADQVSVRGKSSGSFVFALMDDGCAVEISRSASSWWLEFWEASSDPKAPSVGEAEVGSGSEAVAKAIAWLSRRR